MFSNKINISHFIFIFSNVITQIQTLVELPIVEDNNIAIVESAIRNTVNNLFASFKIDRINHTPRLKQYSIIHNYFVSITLQDCKNLKEIARLTRVNNIDNNTQHFIAQINEVLNEDDKSNEAGDNNNLHATRYINKFIRKLKYLKDLYVSDYKTAINADILKYLQNHESPLTNITDLYNVNNTNRTTKNVLNDNEFWQPSGRRIFNGVRTSIKTFPFMASVQFFRKFQCAGSIIKDDLVITSSSCLQLAWNNRFFRENPSFLSVQVGSDKYENDGENIGVLEIIFHPNYSPDRLKNNLALMRLIRKVFFSESKNKVQKIDFDRNPWPMPINANRITVIGWGAKDKTNIINNVFRNILSYAELDYYPLVDCQEHYSQEYVTEKNFCAGFYSIGAGACNRDGGGPGIVGGTLMGIISFGSPVCGAPDSPTVFTKLGYYADWIESVMEQENKQQRQPTTTTSYKALLPLELEEIPRTTFNFTPITHFTMDIKMTTEEPTTHSLRVLKAGADQKFTNFLSTMFVSEEIDEYFNEASSNLIEDISIDSGETKESKPKQDVKRHKSKSITKKKTTTNEIVTQIYSGSVESFDEDLINEEEDTKQPERHVTVMDYASNNDLETNIMALINNLDVDKIILPEETSLKQVDGSEENQKILDKIITQDVSKSLDRESSINSNLQNDVNYVAISQEKQDDDDGGLSIPTDTFKDLTFREKYNNNKKPLSLSSFAELISIAIEEEKNKLKNKHYTL